MQIDKNTKKKLEFIDFYKQASNAATGSKFDSNANVASKNIATLQTELGKKDIIDLNRVITGQYIEKLYGPELAEQYMKDLEHHIIYTHDESSLMPYCCSISLYPYLLSGLKDLGGSSQPPKHANSYIGGLINLIFLVAGQFAGAVAIPEFLTYFDHFLRVDYGEDYIHHLDEIVESVGEHNFNLRHKIEDWFQQFVYSINQPAGARNYQSPFTNIAYFDRYYFENIFADFVFPDGDEPCWETTKELQKMFMKWFNEERLHSVLTFPVETANILVEDGKYKDEEMADFFAEMWSEGHSFFMYQSDSVDALASCCFSKDTLTLVRTPNGNKVKFVTFGDIASWPEGKDHLTILHNGKWVTGKLVQLPNRPMYQITTEKNQKIVVSDNHLHPTLRGNIPTTQLNGDDYLLLNIEPLKAVEEYDLHLTYRDGFLVGVFLNDEYNPFEENPELLELLDFLKTWTNWTKDTNDFNKTLNMDCLLQSQEFRKGILDGLSQTCHDEMQGHMLNGYFTYSKPLIKCVETLATSLGFISRLEPLFYDQNTGHLYTYDPECHHSSPLYFITWWTDRSENSVKIKSITPYEYDSDIYCFEMDNQNEPYFTLPNGIITHNCRLRNAVEDNSFSFSLGAGAIETGSKRVCTLNLNRIVQDWKKESTGTLREYIGDIATRVHKYLRAWNAKLWDDFDSGILTVYKAGFIDLDKQYLTLGVNGCVEAAEFLGITIDPYNEEYKQFAKDILGTIKEINMQDRDEHHRWNTEFVPKFFVGI